MEIKNADDLLVTEWERTEVVSWRMLHRRADGNGREWHRESDGTYTPVDGPETERRTALE